jgi:two-component system, chemotaxis family, CheB/CheR fusion protein
VRLRETALEYAQSAQVLVDVKGALVMANRQARQHFSIDQRGILRPFQDTEVSYRPIELRSLIERAYTEHQSIVVGNIERPFNIGEARYFEVQVTPLRDREKAIVASITFVDMTHYHELEAEVHRARQKAETVNEELQSTNEELETTNEELQSTNEELATMNEELQSAKEGLQTINDELRQRTEEPLMSRQPFSPAFRRARVAGRGRGPGVPDFRMELSRRRSLGHTLRRSEREVPAGSRYRIAGAAVEKSDSREHGR